MGASMESKMEQIGKVTLDLSLYPGEDFYCDGPVEDEILELVQKFPKEAYQEQIEEKKKLACILPSFPSEGEYRFLVANG